MLNASQNFVGAMTGVSATVYIKVELLDRYENSMSEIIGEVIDSSLSSSSETNSRRSFTATFYNPDNMYTWDIGGLISINRRVRVYVGLTDCVEDIEYVLLGTFVLENATSSSNEKGEVTAQISGADKWRNIDGQPRGGLTEGLIIPKDMPIVDVIKTIVLRCNDANPAKRIETKFRFSTCNILTPYELVYSHGEARGKILKDLAEMAVFDIYYDVDGYLVFKPKQMDYESIPEIWTYDRSYNTLFSMTEKSIDSANFANKVIVVGSSGRYATVSAIRENNSQTDPLSTQNFEEIVFVWNNGSPDRLIRTTELADNRAEWELYHRSRIYEIHRMSVIPNYLHEVGDVIKIVDEETNTNDNYIIKSFNFSLKHNSYMSIEAYKIRQLSTNMLVAN